MYIYIYIYIYTNYNHTTIITLRKGAFLVEEALPGGAAAESGLVLEGDRPRTEGFYHVPNHQNG